MSISFSGSIFTALRREVSSQWPHETKIDWEAKAKEEYFFSYPRALAAIKTARAIAGKDKTPDWKLVYDVCENNTWTIPKVFTSFCIDALVERIAIMYQQLESKPHQVLPFIYYLHGKYCTDLKHLTDWLVMSECCIEILNFDDKEIGNNGATILAAALQHPNNKFTSIYLKCSNIGDAEVILIAKALQHTNCKLKKLGLERNRISDIGAKAIVEALTNANCQLTLLDISDNRIGGAGAKAIAQAVVARRKQGKTIEIIATGDFDSLITEAEQEEKKLEQKKREELERQEQRARLAIWKKQIVDGSIVVLELANCTVLDEGNEAKPRKLTVGDLAPIFTALQSNKSITTINLSNNGAIDAKIIDSLIQVLSGNYGWGWWQAFSTPTPNLTLNCVDLRGTKVTGDEAVKLFNHAKSLATKTPRAKFTVFYDGGELKFDYLKNKPEGPKDAKEEKEVKQKQTEELRTGVNHPLLQNLTVSQASTVSATSSLSTVTSAPALIHTAQNSWIIEFKDILSKHQEFQNLDVDLQDQALKSIDVFVRSQEIGKRRLNCKSAKDLEDLIAECISSGISSLKKRY